MDLVAATLDPNLLAPTFGDPSWDAWRTCLRSVFALPPGPGLADLRLFERATGRRVWPREPVREAWVCAGRRSGKSHVAALLAVYCAAFRQYDLAPGQRATVAIIAADRKQARTVFGYAKGLLDHKLLRPLVTAERADSVDLRNGVTIEVHTASYRSTRGYTLACVVADEIAFWKSDDSAQPDVEILAALRPALATIPGSLLFAISTPYARRGALWRASERYFGKDDTGASRGLFWTAPSLTMNPKIDERIIAEAIDEDPAVAQAEWLAQFRSDLESLLDLDAIRRCIVPDRGELPPGGASRYVAFVDPSGGRSDSMTLSVAHREDDRCVVDVLREIRPPFSPDHAVAEFAELCRGYGIEKVVGDKYGGAWVPERFTAHRLRYEPSALSKSELYAALVAHVNSARIELPDHAKLLSQLCALERRTARGTGRDSIDHAPGGHDDLANAIAGAAQLTIGKRREREVRVFKDIWGFTDLRDEDEGPREPRHLGVFNVPYAFTK